MTTLLDGFYNNEKNFIGDTYSTDNIKELLDYLGNPHNHFKTIHIAGTNGKGSTARFIHSILIEAGFTCGLFTSPHLESVTERIQINHNLISIDSINSYVETIKKNQKSSLTYFDALTVVAFLYFKEYNIDFAIIETGLGGRKDSTNIINPLLSIITDISLDHTEILGNSISEIAYEKAGIIKNNIPAISSNSNEVAESVLINQAKKLNAPYHHIDSSLFSDIIFSEFKSTFTYHDNDNSIQNIEIQSPLYHQIINASSAISTAFFLNNSGFNIDRTSIRDGLKNCFLKGRFEKISETPLVFFDAAHNLSSIKSLMSYLLNSIESGTIEIIITLMKEKDNEAIFSFLSTKGIHISYINIEDTRSLLLVKSPIENMTVYDNWESYTQENHDTIDIFMICGTFRIYNEARNFAQNIDNTEKNS